jgi:nicotinamide-nucleotide amidase
VVTDLLAKQVHEALVHRKQTLALAESCTGGLLTHRLTNFSESSKYLHACLVVYSISAKIDLLEVQKDLIINKGDVSAEVAVSLATGVRNLMQVDIGVGITGIAGPTGATDQYPVGTAFIALAGSDINKVKEVYNNGSRIENKDFFTNQALKLLLDYLEN